jgi:hypothetical protein
VVPTLYFDLGISFFRHELSDISNDIPSYNSTNRKIEIPNCTVPYASCGFGIKSFVYKNIAVIPALELSFIPVNYNLIFSDGGKVDYINNYVTLGLTLGVSF